LNSQNYLKGPLKEDNSLLEVGWVLGRSCGKVRIGSQSDVYITHEQKFTDQSATDP
jgi:hypothetical protein